MKEFYTNVKILGNNVCYRGINSSGKHIQFKCEYSPKVYVSSKSESKFKTLDGKFVDEIEPGSIKETRDFIKRYEEVDNFEILGEIDYSVQYISDKFKDVIDWDIDKLSIQIIDIETASETVNAVQHKLTAPEEILLISIGDLSTKKITTFTSREYTGTNENGADIILCRDEYSLLNQFLDHWNSVNVDVVSGFNIDGFDIPYLVNRISNVMGDDHVKRLSPWKLVTPRKVKGKFGKEDTEYDIAGISSLDFLALYLKFTYIKREQNSLDYISQVELGVGKLDHSEFATFKDFYTNGFSKFLDYNIVDVMRVIQLEEKLNLINQALMLAYLAKVNYNDVFSPIRTWDAIIYNHLKSQNIVIPKKASGSKAEQFEGAYVKEPIPGMYHWVLSEDATALYPSIMQSWNISPETYIGVDDKISVSGLMRKECIPSKEYATAANGAMFDKSKKGMLPEMIDVFMDMRRSSKNSMIAAEQKLEELKKYKNYSKAEYKLLQNEISRYNVTQMCFKILLNSLYGAIGNAYCRYFELEMARAITLTGQYIIKTVGDGLNNDLGEMFKIEDYDWSFYSDTDSCYITLKPMVEKYYKDVSDEKLVSIIDKIAKEKITPIINKYCLDLQTYTNSYRNMISFKQESISKNGVWVAKKRYFMNVLDNEGVRYTTPKLKVLGLEVVKSSTPGIVRERLKTCLSLILDNKEDELQAFITEFKSIFNSLPVEDIASPRGVNGIEKYSNSNTGYNSGCPLHTKGAILYNNKLKSLKLENVYPLVNEGDKIKYTYLITPNPIKDIVVSFPYELPKEFNLQEYIDYNKQFEKTFLEPINAILKIIQWNTEKKNSIEDFFC